MEACSRMYLGAYHKCCALDSYACTALYGLKAASVEDCPDFAAPLSSFNDNCKGESMLHNRMETCDYHAQEDAICEDVLNPSHYKSHLSGIECIEITQHMGFLDGNALKYLWRAGLKADKVQDLKKAIWYIEKLIEKEAK